MGCWIVMAAETYKTSPSGPIALRQLSGFSTPGSLLFHRAWRWQHDGPAGKAPFGNEPSIDLPQARS